mmetsp:Transcript_11935/g.19382  ORF Transcript_11935/g.19382 Transcript_11935/m.19382 type:complete len:479 (-) Transcript_11935:432-1868(-)
MMNNRNIQGLGSWVRMFSRPQTSPATLGFAARTFVGSSMRKDGLVSKGLMSRKFSSMPFESFSAEEEQDRTEDSLEKRLSHMDKMFYKGLDFTTEVNLREANHIEPLPIFRVLDLDGEILEGANVPELDEDFALQLYRSMVRLQMMDNVFYDAQRQGRISFYMTHTGEEACSVASAAALDPGDPVFSQYREAGALLWRGFTPQEFADQCFGNSGDLGKGRMMPVHYGSKELNFHTISSPLGTQIIQAAGAAYALKMDNSGLCAMCYFGEGAASEGDFHAGLNFAASLGVPVVFFIRNNGYAISTPAGEQYQGDGVGARAAGYGAAALRADGNDPLAVLAAARAARAAAVRGSRPVVVEAMTYRVGHHSTSDDSSRYRDSTEINTWKEMNSPLTRFKRFLETQGWIDDVESQSMMDAERAGVIKALEKAERTPPPPLSSMFEDVYHEKPWHLQAQEKEMLEYMQRDTTGTYKKFGSGHH